MLSKLIIASITSLVVAWVFTSFSVRRQPQMLMPASPISQGNLDKIIYPPLHSRNNWNDWDWIRRDMGEEIARIAQGSVEDIAPWTELDYRGKTLVFEGDVSISTRPGEATADALLLTDADVSVFVDGKLIMSPNRPLHILWHGWIYETLGFQFVGGQTYHIRVEYSRKNNRHHGGGVLGLYFLDKQINFMRHE